MAGKNKKIIKKVFYLSFLLFCREAYLLIKNLFGLLYHPFLTIRELRHQRNIFQILLILTAVSSPLSLMSLVIAGYLFAKYYLGFYFLTKASFFLQTAGLTAFFFFVLTILYLCFWLASVVRKNHYQFFIDRRENELC